MKFLLTLAFAGIAALSCAQDFLHRPSPFAGRTLLTVELFPEVRTELKATADENTKVDALATKLSSDMQGVIQTNGEDFDAIRTSIDQLNTKYDADTLKLLTADQVTRLKQLFVQFNGASSIANSLIAADLAITADEKTKVKTAQDSYYGKVRDAFSGGAEPVAVEATLKKLHDELNADLDKVLTDDQRTKLKGMEGAKFEFMKVVAPAQ